MCIYPEGTRSTNGELGEFKGGSLKMAQKAKAPIVPVAIRGTRAVSYTHLDVYKRQLCILSNIGCCRNYFYQITKKVKAHQFFRNFLFF